MRKNITLPSLKPWSHWNTERLRKEKEENPRSFARGFQMKAFTDDEKMFPSFEQCFVPVTVEQNQRNGFPTYMGVDLAGPKRPGTVIFVASVDPSTGRRFPLEIATGSWTSPETARQLCAMHNKYPNTHVIMVENNGYQQALIDWIQSSPYDHSFWFKIESFTTGANKAKLDIGLPSLEVEFRNKAWVIPFAEFEKHHPTCHCGWCTWRYEVRDYPLSATTDTVMAMWFCREAISKWSTTIAQGGRSGGLSGINRR